MLGLPDLKEKAREALDNIEEPVGMFQIAVDFKGHVAVCIGGIPSVLVDVMGQAMKNNHQLKDLVEQALCESIDIKTSQE